MEKQRTKKRKNSFEVDKTIRMLSTKKDIKIIESTRTIEILTGKHPTFPRQNDLGNGSWGKIDYLTKYRGFTLISVPSFGLNKRKKKRRIKKIVL